MICKHGREQRKSCDLPECRYCEKCGMGGHTNFVERVTNWIDEGAIINEGLSICGPQLIAKLTRGISLRELARQTGLSPTYLSLVANAKVTISPGSFVKLSLLDKRRDNQ